MNLLYISHLCDSVASGLNFSVPAGIAAQCKFDDVLWVDISNAQWESWKKVPAYHNIKEFGKLDLTLLPEPFKKPDCVIFEGFYELDDIKFAKKLQRKNIPYIIIPRGSLTYSAMHNHSRLKKEIAHLFFFDPYIKNSLAIQYLTDKEKEDSAYRFSHNSFVIPNGFLKQEIVKETFSQNEIRAIFIGRLDMYHKGLDMLLNVIEKNFCILKDSGFILTLYGPESYDYRIIKNRLESTRLHEIISLGGSIAGEEKKNAILKSDLFVMPSRFEGHPMGLIEALANGLPALVTRGCNMLDEILSSNAGWVCETSESDLEKAILIMIKEKNLLSEKGKNARILSEQYDWDVLANKFHNKLKELLN